MLPGMIRWGDGAGIILGVIIGHFIWTSRIATYSSVVLRRTSQFVPLIPISYMAFLKVLTLDSTLCLLI